MEVLGKVYYPIQFFSRKIFYHPEFENDLRDLIEKGGFERRFKPLFEQRMNFLEERMLKCTQKKDWFEKLKIQMIYLRYGLINKLKI